MVVNPAQSRRLVFLENIYANIFTFCVSVYISIQEKINLIC